MRTFRLALTSFLLLIFVGCTPPPYADYDLKDIRQRWSTEIKAFDALNKAGLPKDPILFYGSSSIRLWENIQTDLTPLSVVRRGYGGASLHDASYFAKRVLYPIDYRALVLFIGNDIWGNEFDKTPAEMRKLMKYIIGVSRKHRPNAEIFLIEVTHVPARAHLMAEWDAANEMLKELAKSNDDLHFIRTKDLYVKPNGEIRAELFRDDDIHQNDQGYELWKVRIKRELLRVLERV
jgi:hypothetical protein